jgi:flavin reductase (DIM6/NTAB) family NADH-FMN oxidoreductase RutF
MNIVEQALKNAVPERIKSHEKSVVVEGLPVTRTGTGGPFGYGHKGHTNVMAISWHMMVEFTLPLVACIVSNADYNFAALRSTKECVIAIPSRKLAYKVVDMGNCSGLDVDKFKRFSLTAAPAKQVAAPRITECFTNLECKVVNTRLVGEYNLFALEVVKA